VLHWWTVKLPVQPVVKHTYRVTICLSKLCTAGRHTAMLGTDVRDVSHSLFFGRSFIRIWSRLPYVFIDSLRGFTQSLHGNTRIGPQISLWPCMSFELDFCLTVHHQLGKIIQMNQLDATMIYWSIRSAQHVSDNILPIIRSLRLRYLQHMVSCYCGGQEDGERQRGT